MVVFPENIESQLSIRYQHTDFFPRRKLFPSVSTNLVVAGGVLGLPCALWGWRSGSHHGMAAERFPSLRTEMLN